MYSLAAVVFGLIILNQTLKVVSDFWLAKWTDNYEKNVQEKKQDHHFNNTTQEMMITSANVINNNEDNHTMQYYIYTYTIMSLISVIISLTTNISSQLIAIRAVRLLHDNLINTLVRCPLRFFDKTPIGRIMNRFTNDINTIDKVRMCDKFFFSFFISL